MGVPFEALLPYGIMIGVRALSDPGESSTKLTSSRRCSPSVELVFRHLDTCRMVEREGGVGSMHGTG